MKVPLFSLFFLIIITLLNSMIIIVADLCNPISCVRSATSTVFSEHVVVKYPFRVRYREPDSCGRPGFDLYHCDNTSTGLLLELPNSVLLRVDDISYTSNRVVLSDSDDCLPQKLLSLNLTNSPLRSVWTTEQFWVYNCSGDKYYYRDQNLQGSLSRYDRIDCLSGSNYSVISAGSRIIVGVDSSNCTFLKTLIVPVPYSFSAPLSSISAIYLSWNGDDVSSKFPVVGVVLGLLGMVVGIAFCCCFICLRKRYTLNTATTSTNDNAIPQRNARAVSTEVVVVEGLDQATIDTYPLLVVGVSGRLIKSGDETCAICLSDYRSHETLKMLPQCLHRFHADCIDRWLRSKGVCPICRASPPRS